MKIGWHFDSKVNHWYYLNPNGDMKTGWLKYSNKWYYFRPCGKMAELSWVKYKGHMYYFGIFGYMRTDAWIEGFPEEVKIDLDKYAREGMFYPRYYVDREGKYRPTAKESFKGEIGQWKDTSDGRFFIYSDGTYANGPVFIDGKLYLFLPDLKKGYSFAEILGYNYSDQNGVFQNKENLEFDKDGRAIAKNGDRLFENNETGGIEVLK